MIASFLIFPSEPDGEALLAKRAGTSAVIERGDTDALATRLTAPYALILPGQAVRAFLTDLPEGAKSADRLNVARFAHEDRLAAAPSDLHIVLDDKAPARTLVIDPAVIDDLLAVSDPQMILADHDALGAWDGRNIWLIDRVVKPGVSGLTLDADWADGSPERPDVKEIAEAIFARIDAKEALNLRSGRYRRRMQVQTGPWMKVAAALVACAGLGLALSLADARATQAQADALAAQARAQYTQVTGQPAPDNLSRLARQAGTTSSNPAAFLDLSQTLFSALAQQPDVKVDRLSYQEDENALRLRLIYPDFESAGNLEAVFAQSGAVFTTGGVREQGGQFIGDASLSLGASS